MSQTCAGLLPVTRNQLQQLRMDLMSKIDELLSEVADKLDRAADVITGELNKLQSEIAAGKPTDATMAKLHAAADRIHGIVDSDLEPGGEGGEGEGEELEGEEHEHEG